MKIPNSLLLFIAAMSPAALLVSGCSKDGSARSTVQTAKNDAQPAVQDTGAAATNAGDGVRAAVAESRDGMKDYAYRDRVDLAADVNRMAAKLDGKVHEIEMSGKLAGIPAAGKDRDDADKEFDAARAGLKARLAGLDHATAETWADAKGEVMQAWARMQAAYEKVASFGTDTNPATMATPPPSPLAETKPPSPGSNYTWVAGRYTPVKGEWTWVAGTWSIPPTVESVWILGNYDAKTQRWSEAHWQPDGVQTVYTP